MTRKAQQSGLLPSFVSDWRMYQEKIVYSKHIPCHFESACTTLMIVRRQQQSIDLIWASFKNIRKSKISLEPSTKIVFHSFSCTSTVSTVKTTHLFQRLWPSSGRQRIAMSYPMNNSTVIVNADIPDWTIFFSLARFLFAVTVIVSSLGDDYHPKNLWLCLTHHVKSCLGGFHVAQLYKSRHWFWHSA